MAIASPEIDDLVTLDGQAGNPPVLTGTDPKDQPVSGALTGKKVAITSLPANGTLYYSSNPIVFGRNGIEAPTPQNPYDITAYDPSQLQLKFTGNGYNNTSFTYAYINSDEQMSAPANYKLSWGNPLPVQLIGFTGKGLACSVQLNWQTAQENNAQHFVVERSSTGKAFEKEGIVQSKGNNSQYNFECAASSGQSDYFRLRMVDRDGKETMSKTLRVATACNENNVVTVAPNPMTDKVTVSGGAAGYQIIIRDLTGRRVLEMKMKHCQVQLDLSALQAGNYYLQLSNAGKEVFHTMLLKK